MRKHSDESVLADLIFRQVEAANWQPTLSEKQGFSFAALRKETHKFASGAHRSKAEAVCSVAAKLTRSGAFNFPNVT